MMKILLIGSGGNMGKNHYRVLNKYLQTTEHELMTCDSNVKNSAPDFKDYKVAIKEFAPQYVIIAAPTELHEEILDYCIEQKVKNVLVEKPIALCDCSKYIGLKDTKIMVGHTERYNPMVKVLVEQLNKRDVDTIICTRSGIASDKVHKDLNTDLCVHDSDACQLIVRHLNYGSVQYDKIGIKNVDDSCNIFVILNGVKCFLHADTKSPYKCREIKVMGKGYILEGDYINQRVYENGKEIVFSKSEPLLNEIETFLTNKFTENDLLEAINNLSIVQE